MLYQNDLLLFTHPTTTRQQAFLTSFITERPLLCYITHILTAVSLPFWHQHRSRSPPNGRCSATSHTYSRRCHFHFGTSTGLDHQHRSRMSNPSSPLHRFVFEQTTRERRLARLPSGLNRQRSTIPTPVAGPFMTCRHVGMQAAPTQTQRMLEPSLSTFLQQTVEPGGRCPPFSRLDLDSIARPSPACSISVITKEGIAPGGIFFAGGHASVLASGRGGGH